MERDTLCNLLNSNSLLIWWKIQRKDIIQIPDRAPLGFRNPEDRRSIVVLILYRFEIFTVELQLR